MVLLIVFLTAIAMTSALVLLAAYSDLEKMLIDNSYSIIIAALFFTTYAAAYIFGKADIFAPFWVHITSGVIMFFVTFALFSFGILGGADSKLITAISFWIGFSGLPAFLVSASLIGGALGIAALLLKRFPVLTNIGQQSWIARTQAGEKTVPYAVAIAGGTFVSFYQLGFFNLKHLGVLLT